MRSILVIGSRLPSVTHLDRGGYEEGAIVGRNHRLYYEQAKRNHYC